MAKKEALTLEDVIDNTLSSGIFQPAYEPFLRKFPYGDGLYHAVLGHQFFVERVQYLKDQVIKNVYYMELLLTALDVKENIKDLSPLEALDINRIEVLTPDEEKLKIICKNAAKMLNDFVMICGYDCLTKALYAETELEPLKHLFINVTTTTKRRKVSYRDMYYSNDFYIESLEDALQIHYAQMEDLKKRLKMPFMMWNYKGYLVTKGVIEKAKQDLTTDGVATPHQYIEHIRKRYTKDSERYKYHYGLSQWYEFCDY